MKNNSGDCNSGDYNSGNYNSGDYNRGNYNGGNYNSGDYNSGNFNSGDCNSGNYNNGNYNSGDCNTNTPTVRIFNKDSGWDFNGNFHTRFKNIIFNKYTKPVLRWILKDNMTDEEIRNNPECKTTGGFLRMVGNKQHTPLTKNDRVFLLSVPNFDKDILFKTTGIKIDATKTLTIDGKHIEISEESFNELKKQLTGE